jgi:hypothetical protein
MSFLAQALATVCLVVGGGLAVGALVESRHALLLWRARRVRARELDAGADSAGVFEVRGPARAKVPLRAPLTGAACIQFTVILERERPPDGRSPDGDPDTLTFVGTSPFVVEDGTGSLEVDLRTSRAPLTGTRIERKPLARLTAPLEELLAVRLGKPGGLWCHGRAVTATEAALLEGAEVSVVARRSAAGVRPLHVTTGRVRVVALQGLMRAAIALAVAVVLLNVWFFLGR